MFIFVTTKLKKYEIGQKKPNTKHRFNFVFELKVGKILFEAPTTNSCVKFEQNRFRDAMQPLSSEHNYSPIYRGGLK